MNIVVLEQFLKKFNLSADQQNVFHKLVVGGEQTVLQLSRLTKINRTSLYRVLDELESLGFVTKGAKTKTTKYTPIPLELLEAKIEQEHARVDDLSRSFIALLPQLEGLYDSRKSDINVIHYTGREQARQLVWNSLKAKNGIKSFGYRTMKEAMGIDFMYKWWDETVLRKIKTWMIANPDTFEMKTWGNETPLASAYVASELYLKRYFEKSELEIINETFIYNDVFAVLQWDEQQVFGVEIHNNSVARQQELVFDFLWKKAKEYKG